MKCIIIGNGKMAIDCYKILIDYNWEIKFILSSPTEDKKGTSFQKYLLKEEVLFYTEENINTALGKYNFKPKEVDVVFTINSYKVIKGDWFKVAELGIVNFHNSYLPNYKGVNISYWVIQNGEKEHGITWHFINNKLDQGRAIYNEKFELSGKETNARLSNTCIKKGIDVFPLVLDRISSMKSLDMLEIIGDGTCYYYKDKPLGNGIIDFSLDYDKIDGLVRGLNYLPYSNEMEYARFTHKEKTVIVNKITKQKKRDQEVVGSFCGFDGRGVPVIACSNYLFTLEECMTVDFKLLEGKDIFN